MGILDVPGSKFVEALAQELKKYPELEPPRFVYFVKTGAHAERPPQNPDFWYIRCASILRRAYIEKVIGVGRLRTYYGGRKNHGSCPEHHVDAGGSIIRKALQALEKAGLLEKAGKGRKLTVKGRKLLIDISKTFGVTDARPEGLFGGGAPEAEGTGTSEKAVIKKTSKSRSKRTTSKREAGKSRTSKKS